MFIVGLGLGALLTSQGCRKKGRLPGDEEQAAPRPGTRPAPKAPASHRPSAQDVPAPVEVPPVKAVPAVPAVPAAPAPPAPATLPRLALVIDDLGYAPPELVTRLCAQSVPFSVAVLPYQEFTRASADLAYGAGKEVMLHLPMEPIGYPAPGKDPGPTFSSA